MNIFITGATGYIGFNVARAFRRAGHKVWGLTRSENKAKKLAEQEIIPVIGDMNNPGSYREIAEKSSVLIHAAADYENDTAELDRKTIDTFLEAAKKGAVPKTILYTSGCWVIGDTGNTAIDETTPLKPIQAVAWRPAHEQMILGAGHVRGLVLRPGCVYGERGGLTAAWFQGAEDGNLEIIGNGTNYWTMVHVEDLASAYVLAAESSYDGVFNISDRSRWTVGEMVSAVAAVTEFEREIRQIPVDEAAKDMGPVAEALALNQLVDAGKAERLLNWHPRHHGFVNEVEIFYRSWKAWK